MRASLVLASLVLSGFSAATHAATITVDTTTDASLQACTAAAGDCSFRGAILRSNALAGLDTIAFAIPTSEPGCNATTGVCRISPLTIHEAFLGAAIVDGYTQPGASANTLTPAQGGSNAVLKIELHGGQCTNCTSSGPLRIGDGTTIRGLVINGFAQAPGINVGDFFFSLAGSNTRFEGNFIGTDATGTVAIPNRDGISIGGGSFRAIGVTIGGSTPEARNVISGNAGTGIASAGNTVTIRGNLIGTDAAGTAAIPNRGQGIFVGACGFGSGITGEIGGPAVGDRNLISGNALSGIVIGSPNGGCGNASDHRIRGNYIGTDISGVLPVPNGTGIPGQGNGSNILMRTAGTASAPNRVGGILPGEGNRIAFARTNPALGADGGDGVVLPASTFVSVRGNSMIGNAQLGIDGGTEGRSPNDAGDADNFFASGNSGRNQNFPEIVQFLPGAGSAQLTYRVDSAIANAIYPIETDFYVAAGDEGFIYLGSDTYTAAEAQTAKAITLTYPAGVTVPVDARIVATAVDADLNQSEFSFQTASLAIGAPGGSSCTTGDSVYCDGFEGTGGASISVRVTATALNGAFPPNGEVLVTDDRGASCTATLQTSAPLSSVGTCILVNSGAAGPISITATLVTARSAFASPTGGNVVATANFNNP